MGVFAPMDMVLEEFGESVTLRLRDTGCIGTQCCTHNQLKMYCEQLAKNCSTVYYFSRMI